MTGEKDIKKLLENMNPILCEQEYVFVTTNKKIDEIILLNPLCTFMEEEGLTLIVEKNTAISNCLKFDGVFKKITLKIHSSLDAVGLTAAVASKLKDYNISANVVAAYYHDHIFVQSNLSEKALNCLNELTSQSILKL